MSEMLEQAIIDATALKQAAVKNAETLVLEKYSNEIESAVQALLEQDAPEADLPDMLGTPDAPEADLGGSDPTAGQAQLSVSDDIPMASTDDSDATIEIALDQLMEELDLAAEDLDMDLTEEDLDPLEELELAEIELEEEEAKPEEPVEDDAAAAIEKANQTSDESFIARMTQAMAEARQETVAEQLTVDIKPMKRGWAGISEGELEIAEEELLAMEQDSKVREERAAIRKAVKALEGVNESLVEKNNTLKESLSNKDGKIKQLQKIASLMKEELENLSLTNTKLVLQNKALTSDSLNGRQKQKLAEAISNVETAEEAKVIFETLQNTVGSTSHKKQPESLSEAVQKSSSIIMSSRRENSERQKANPTLNRWKFLAGIQKD